MAHLPRGRSLSEEEELLNLLAGVLPKQSNEDRRIWIHNRAEGYTPFEAYQLMQPDFNLLDSTSCKRLWNKLIPSKVSVFGWRLLLNRLPTKDQLLLQDSIQPSMSSCPLYEKDPELIDHLFVACTNSRIIWLWLSQWWGIQTAQPNSIREINQGFTFGISNLIHNDLWFSMFLITTWSIWYSRNKICFSGGSWDLEKIFKSIPRRSYLWIKRRFPHSSIHPSHLFSQPLVCAEEIFRA